MKKKVYFLISFMEWVNSKVQVKKTDKTKQKYYQVYNDMR